MAFIPPCLFPQICSDPEIRSADEIGVLDPEAELVALENEHRGRMTAIANQYSEIIPVGKNIESEKGDDEEEEEIDEDDEFESADADDLEELEANELYMEEADPVDANQSNLAA